MLSFNDPKEEQLFLYYWNRIVGREFDEHDIYSLLILIRGLNPKGEIPLHIRDYGDLIAHRRRNRGAAIDAISGAKSNHYEINSSNKVKGYKGASLEEWEKEWNELAILTKQSSLPNETIREIVLCIMALSQFVQLNKSEDEIDAEFTLHLGNHNKIALCTHEKGNNNVYATYTVLDKIEIIHPECYEDAHYQICDPVEAIRENGVLRLRTERGYLL